MPSDSCRCTVWLVGELGVSCACLPSISRGKLQVRRHFNLPERWPFRLLFHLPLVLLYKRLYVTYGRNAVHGVPSVT